MLHSIRQILLSEKYINEVDVLDESNKHQGHSGHIPGHVTHIKLIITINQELNFSKVELHRKIYKLLENYIGNPLHAISISIKE